MRRHWASKAAGPRSARLRPMTSAPLPASAEEEEFDKRRDHKRDHHQPEDSREAQSTARPFSVRIVIAPRVSWTSANSPRCTVPPPGSDICTSLAMDCGLLRDARGHLIATPYRSRPSTVWVTTPDLGDLLYLAEIGADSFSKIKCDQCLIRLPPRSKF